LGTFGRTPERHEDELARLSGSSLEQAWLAHVDRHGYRRPDRGQESIPDCNTCADFFYADWKAAIYIDGPQHDEAAQRERDEAINRALAASGHYVVRFPKEQARWPEVFTAHAGLFGPGNDH